MKFTMSNRLNLRINTLMLVLMIAIFVPKTWAVEQNSSIETPNLRTGDHIVKHTGFSLLYSEPEEQAKWVAYVLTKEHSMSNVAQREDSFKTDPKITTGSASPKDYVKSGYDKGHLCPAADSKWSVQAMSDCFYMSNMSPQTPSLNRGIWNNLEDKERQVAIEYDRAYIVTAGVLNGQYLGSIGSNGVSVPSSYYKVILIDKPVYRCIGFIIPNGTQFTSLADYACSVDKVETLTGIDFYPAIPDSIENRIESQCDSGLFNFMTSGSPFNTPKSTQTNSATNNLPSPSSSGTTGKYWLTSTGKRHNSGCRYYGTTKTGYYTDDKKGNACKICGG
jgi:endonuclease G